jgi:4-carboxymuconolactone decarboxylase
LQATGDSQQVTGRIRFQSLSLARCLLQGEPSLRAVKIQSNDVRATVHGFRGVRFRTDGWKSPNDRRLFLRLLEAQIWNSDLEVEFSDMNTGHPSPTQSTLLRSDPEAHRDGLALLNRLHGGHSGEQLVASLQEVCPDFATMTIEWALAGVMGRPGLDLITRQLLLIAACTTLGFAMPQLRAHIEAALSIGATREQIVETILQMTFYAGGAATSNAMRTAGEVFQNFFGRASQDAQTMV